MYGIAGSSTRITVIPVIDGSMTSEIFGGKFVLLGGFAFTDNQLKNGKKNEGE